MVQQRSLANWTAIWRLSVITSNDWRMSEKTTTP